MTEQPPKEDTLFILKELEVNPNSTQRDLSSRLNISLGKTNEPNLLWLVSEEK